MYNIMARGGDNPNWKQNLIDEMSARITEDRKQRGHAPEFETNMTWNELKDMYARNSRIDGDDLSPFFADLADAMYRTQPMSPPLAIDNLFWFFDASSKIYAFAAFFMVIKLLEVFSYLNDFGEKYVMLTSMVHGSTWVVALMLLMSISVGVLWQSLRPRVLQQDSLGVGEYNWYGFQEPVFQTLWAMMGDPLPPENLFATHWSEGINTTHYYLRRIWWALPLAYLWTIVSSVFVVNLLIAQMTSTYDSIRTRSNDFRLSQRVNLIVEYKDGHGPMPPPFNLLYSLWKRTRKVWSRPKSVDEHQRKHPGYATAISFQRKQELETKTRVYLRLCHEEQLAREAETLESKVSHVHNTLASVKELVKSVTSVEETLINLSIRVEDSLTILKCLSPEVAGAVLPEGADIAASSPRAAVRNTFIAQPPSTAAPIEALPAPAKRGFDVGNLMPDPARQQQAAAAAQHVMPPPPSQQPIGAVAPRQSYRHLVHSQQVYDAPVEASIGRRRRRHREPTGSEAMQFTATTVGIDRVSASDRLAMARAEAMRQEQVLQRQEADHLAASRQGLINRGLDTRRPFPLYDEIEALLGI